jgi:DnaK suppressor protein
MTVGKGRGVLDGPDGVGYRKFFIAIHPYPDATTTMTTTESSKYRDTLLALRNRLNGDVTHMTGEALREAGGEASGGISNTPLHMADLGTDNFEQEFTLGLIQNEEQTITEIDAALARLRNGTFGRCEECQQEIPVTRLQALPYTRHCVACARKHEQGV